MCDCVPACASNLAGVNGIWFTSHYTIGNLGQSVYTKDKGSNILCSYYCKATTCNHIHVYLVYSSFCVFNNKLKVYGDVMFLKAFDLRMPNTLRVRNSLHGCKYPWVYYYSGGTKFPGMPQSLYKTPAQCKWQQDQEYAATNMHHTAFASIDAERW